MRLTGLAREGFLRAAYLGAGICGFRLKMEDGQARIANCGIEADDEMQGKKD